MIAAPVPFVIGMALLTVICIGIGLAACWVWNRIAGARLADARLKRRT